MFVSNQFAIVLSRVVEAVCITYDVIGFNVQWNGFRSIYRGGLGNKLQTSDPTTTPSGCVVAS